MRIEKPVFEARLVRRYKRFLADVLLESGEEMTVYCPNPGRMIGVREEGSRVLLRDDDSPKRKLRYTLMAVHADGAWVAVDTALANPLIAEAVTRGEIPELRGYASLRREVAYGAGSRIDLLLEEPGRCLVEVKSTTLLQDDIALFPDAPSVRALKHVKELEHCVRNGERAILFFVVCRENAERFVPADDIDPAWSEAVRHAAAQGVECLAWTAEISPAEISLKNPIPVCLKESVSLRETR